MQRTWLVIAAVSALCTAGVTAQEPTPPPAPAPAPRAPRAPRVARSPNAFAFAWSDNHGRIGVVIDTRANAESDKIGAKIEAVTPGGPADKGGLKVGDIITKFASTSLGGLKAEDEDESGPGRKLIALARKLEPGDTVRLEYRRGSDTKQATLVAEDLDGRVRVEMRDPVMAMPKVMPMPGMDFMWEEPWGDLDMVSLNPDLGDYFGTREGILVVKAPADSSLPLKGGDVILSIGGRKPTSQAHAMRILRSYEPGESVSIDIMRKQKRMTLTWQVPDPERRMRHEMERKERQEESSLRRLWQRQQQDVERMARERLTDLRRQLEEKQVEMRRLLRRVTHLQQV